MRRGLYYLLLTGTVGAAYVAAVVLLNVVLQANALTGSAAFPVFFTLVILLLLNPLRSRLQAFVDRAFYRTRYDPARALSALGQELGGTLRRERIAALVRECVDGTIPNAGTRLFVVSAGGPDLVEMGMGGEARVGPTLLGRLSEGGVVTRDGEPGLRHDLAEIGAVLAMPLELRGELTGALTVGEKRSGLHWTPDDLEFLGAVANHAAIALENARSYETLVDLNARLEERVRERTAQLEVMHQELASAYADLKSAETQLVHSEKMASLGRLVAGVAHEINNPVSFIATSVAPLRKRLAEAATEAPADVVPLLKEAEEIADVMARGAERTAAIVRDLRSFSRLGEAKRKPADLHEGLEVSLRLLESRWKGRVTVHRDYGEMPLVECDPGQLNQVFMNVLANACDATPANGNIWIATRREGDEAVVTVRDDGAGMAPEVREHVFDPFFTTKDVGGGTGLGLAISHGVVTAHGGRIEVESAPGSGATFRIVLPIGDAASLDRAASGTR
jgi:signal transduction histidine kinase